jgi:hypothetical protein
MATFTESTFNYIILFDSIDVKIEYQSNSVDNLLLNDNVQVFDYFKVDNNDNTRFNINTNITISDYIKRIPENYIKIGELSKAILKSKDIVDDTITISDNSISHISAHKKSTDQLVIRTSSYVTIKYAPDDVSDNSNFFDSVSSIISKHSSRRFKNAVYSLLGTTEEILYTCNGKSTTIINISFCNRTINDVLINILLYKSGIPTYIGKEILIKPHQAYIINNNDETNIQLEENDEIRVVANIDNSSDVYMALIEQI